MEMVDLYDENRLPLGRTAERYAPKGEGEYRVVVHICVFDSRGRLLIQQRSREKAVWPEAWDVSAAPADWLPPLDPQPAIRPSSSTAASRPEQNRLIFICASPPYS